MSKYTTDELGDDIMCEKCGYSPARFEWSNEHEIQRQEDEEITRVCENCWEELADTINC